MNIKQKILVSFVYVILIVRFTKVYFLQGLSLNVYFSDKLKKNSVVIF